tara:strand:- start:180 stop:542 length:363 start_codon:yes stop_codon:yes gene_type:complete
METCNMDERTNEEKLLASNTALREELAALKAYNSALVSAKTAFIDSEQWEGEAGYLRPDNAEEMLNAAFNKTPAQSLAKVRADAIRSVLDTPHDCETPNGDIAWSSRAIEEHANKIEGGL